MQASQQRALLLVLQPWQASRCTVEGDSLSRRDVAAESSSQVTGPAELWPNPQVAGLHVGRHEPQDYCLAGKYGMCSRQAMCDCNCRRRCRGHLCSGRACAECCWCSSMGLGSAHLAHLDLSLIGEAQALQGTSAPLSAAGEGILACVGMFTWLHVCGKPTDRANQLCQPHGTCKTWHMLRSGGEGRDADACRAGCRLLFPGSRPNYGTVKAARYCNLTHREAA